MTSNNVCFVISPIGHPGTENHATFKQVLEYTIRPAVEASGFNLEVLRADDIDRPGSFIKDILEMLLKSYVVIADLTNQNPNVFYELGVRHALSPRTILIAQDGNHIPSDLKEYRYIVYDTSAKGAAEFREKIKRYLSELTKDPNRPDNPVLDRLPALTDNKLRLQEENAALQVQLRELKNEIENLKHKLDGTTTVHRGPRLLRDRFAETRLPGEETFDTYCALGAQANAHGYWLSVVARFDSPAIAFGSAEKDAIVQTVLHHFHLPEATTEIDLSRNTVRIAAPKSRTGFQAKFTRDGVVLIQTGGMDNVISIPWVLAVAHRCLLVIRDEQLKSVYDNGGGAEIQCSLTNWPSGGLTVEGLTPSSTMTRSAGDRAGIGLALRFTSAGPRGDWKVILEFVGEALAEGGFLHYEELLASVSPESVQSFERLPLVGPDFS